MLQKLFENQTMATIGADVVSNIYETPDYNDRKIFVGGIFGAAQVFLELSPDGRTWFPGDEDPLLEPGFFELEDLQAGVQVRLRLRFANADTLISAWV